MVIYFEISLYKRGLRLGKRTVPLLLLVPILAIVMVFFLILGDFGGFYWEEGSYYLKSRYWEYLSIGHPVSGPIFGIIILLLAAITILMIIGLVSRKGGSSKGIYIAASVLDILIIFLTAAGAAAVAIIGETGDYYDWWYDETCYALSIGSILIFLSLIIMTIRAWKGSAQKEE